MSTMRIRWIEATCNRCNQKHIFYPDKVIEGAQALIDWTKEGLKRFCTCEGPATADIKCKLEDD